MYASTVQLTILRSNLPSLKNTTEMVQLLLLLKGSMHPCLGISFNTSSSVFVFLLLCIG